MAGYFPEEWLSEVLERTDLVELVSSYLPLQKKGKKYWGLCPFHGEKTPSFSVDADKPLYYCFGCKAGGNAIHFIMNMEKLSFPEAVLFLAERLGMQPPETLEDAQEEQKRRQKQRLYELMKCAASLFNMALMQPEGEKARNYLNRRGITPAIITRFGLGYADQSWDGLTETLIKKGYTVEEIRSVGLCTVHGNKKFDMFKDRIMFPIIDQYGRVVAFGGRLIDTDGPKYINSPDTELYNKRRMLYGINFHKKFERTGTVLLVEGYMDLISIVCAGIPNVLASCGTSLTREQAQLIHRFADKVLIAYDGDAAGQVGNLRGLDILSAEGLDVKVLQLPEGMDPDDVVRTYGPVGIRSAMEHALTLMEFKLKVLSQRFDLETENGRMEFAKAAAPLLRELGPIEAERYSRQIAKMTGFSPKTLAEQAAITKEEREDHPKGLFRRKTRQTKEVQEPVPVQQDPERLLLAVACMDSHLAKLAFSHVSAEDFCDETARTLAKCIQEILPAHITTERIFRRLEDPKIAASAAEILSTDVSGLADERSVTSLAAKVLGARIERELEPLYRQMSEGKGNTKDLLRQINEKNELLSDLKNGFMPQGGSRA